MFKLSIIVQQIPPKDQNQLCISLWLSPVVSGNHWGTWVFSSFQNETAAQYCFVLTRSNSTFVGDFYHYFGINDYLEILDLFGAAG